MFCWIVCLVEFPFIQQLTRWSYSVTQLSSLLANYFSQHLQLFYSFYTLLLAISAFYPIPLANYSNNLCLTIARLYPLLAFQPFVHHLSDFIHSHSPCVTTDLGWWEVYLMLCENENICSPLCVDCVLSILKVGLKVLLKLLDTVLNNKH